MTATVPLNSLLIPDPHPTRSDAVKNRALLLETAAALFASQGVDAVSMTAIAEAAGVGKGTLYRHFENKTELCQALLDVDQRGLQERTLLRLREMPDALDNLRWFLGEALGFVERNAQFLCVSTGVVESLQQPAHWWWRQTIRGLLMQLGAAGNLDYLADTLYVLLDVHTVYFLRQVRGYSFEQVRGGLLDAVERLVLP